MRNIIRTGKSEQLYSCIETGLSLGMQPMDRALAELVRRGSVSQDAARSGSIDPDNFLRTLKSMSLGL